MTPREQHLRNEVGQLTHKIHRMADQRREMQADLVWQRGVIKQALDALNRADETAAKRMLQGALDHRENTRIPRRKMEAAE